jgi:8-oxo-dGTP diphosphatase
VPHEQIEREPVDDKLWTANQCQYDDRQGKRRMARAPILAAGGIVVRDGPKPLIALVQRRKDNGWVLPKGKLKRREKPMTAARREAIEETGHNVRVQEFLGAISYRAGGKPKLAQFWRMEAVDEAARKPARDIKAVDWLPLESAIEKLSLPLEQVFLRNVGPRALKAAKEPAAKEPTAKAPRQESTSRRQDSAARRPPVPRPEAAVRAQAAVRTEPTIANLPAVVTAPPASRKTFFQLIFGAFRRAAAGRP